MKQALVTDGQGHSLILWLPMSVVVGGSVRWNGVGYTVSAVYGTHFCMGRDVRRCDHPPRPKDEPNIPEPEELN